MSRRSCSVDVAMKTSDIPYAPLAAAPEDTDPGSRYVFSLGGKLVVEFCGA